MATSLFRCFGRSENMTRYFEKNCVISGAGMSKMYRKPEVYPFNLAVDACRNAIADAGLEIGDIDGIACWPHAAVHVGHGSSAASPVDIKNSLGLKLNWFEAGMGPGQIGRAHVWTNVHSAH